MDAEVRWQGATRGVALRSPCPWSFSQSLLFRAFRCQEKPLGRTHHRRIWCFRRKIPIKTHMQSWRLPALQVQAWRLLVHAQTFHLNPPSTCIHLQSPILIDLCLFMALCLLNPSILAPRCKIWFHRASVPANYPPTKYNQFCFTPRYFTLRSPRAATLSSQLRPNCPPPFRTLQAGRREPKCSSSSVWRGIR